jgi:CheY-like chemotaxis protein
MNTQQVRNAASMETLVPERIPLIILCVDDDPIVLATRRMVLSSAGYHVLTAVSGAGADRLLRRKHVDLLITDHYLPGMTGAELTAVAKTRNPKLPVVVLTGSVDTPAGCERADLVVTKGTPPEEFLATIAKLIAKK